MQALSRMPDCLKTGRHSRNYWQNGICFSIQRILSWADLVLQLSWANNDAVELSKCACHQTENNLWCCYWGQDVLAQRSWQSLLLNKNPPLPSNFLTGSMVSALRTVKLVVSRERTVQGEAGVLMFCLFPLKRPKSFRSILARTGGGCKRLCLCLFWTLSGVGVAGVAWSVLPQFQRSIGHIIQVKGFKACWHDHDTVSHSPVSATVQAHCRVCLESP